MQVLRCRNSRTPHHRCSQLYRYHSRLSFREETVAAGSFGELRAMTVGFVDLASSTELGARLSATDLARSMNDFNREAFTPATRNGARLVKTIGDEAMLCALDPNAVCRAALALVEFSREHATFASARGGIAHGDVLEQDGDCYGPIVNRAARFVESAPDGRVMVDVAVASALGPEFTTTPEPTMEHRPNSPELGDFTLKRSAQVTGLVRDENGSAVADAVVHA